MLIEKPFHVYIKPFLACMKGFPYEYESMPCLLWKLFFHMEAASVCGEISRKGFWSEARLVGLQLTPPVDSGGRRGARLTECWFSGETRLVGLRLAAIVA